MKRIAIVIVIVTILHLSYLTAQNDSLNIKAFNNYFQINMGLSYGNLNGNVSNFTKEAGSFDMSFANGKGKHIYGYNMNIMMSNKINEFTIPEGYEHYDNPATIFFGLFYGQVLGNQQKSHFQATIGLDYGWLIHRKRDKDVRGHHGIVPKIEVSKSFRIGKTDYSVLQYTGQYTPMIVDPTLTNKFIDIFLGYKQLLLNNSQGKGGLFLVGLRYKLNQYSIRANVMN